MYGESTVSDSIAQKIIPLNPYTASMFTSLQKHVVESDEGWFGVGLKPAFEKEYFELTETNTFPSMFEGSLLQYQIMMHPDVIKHTRSIYTILDFLGDVGGLSDALKILGGIAVLLF